MAASRWDEIVRSHLDAPIDEHFAEPVTIRPMVKSPNGRSMQDPNRQVVTVQGVFTRRPRRTDVQIGNRTAGGRGGHDFRTLMEGTLPRLSVPDSAFASGAPPRQGDHVQVAGERYEVVSAKHDDVSRFKLDLVAIGAAA